MADDGSPDAAQDSLTIASETDRDPPSGAVSPTAPPKSSSPVSQRSIFANKSTTTLQTLATTSSAATGAVSPAPLERTSTKAENAWTALFDDHVANTYVPGSLHLAPDSTIERLIERQGGALPLIRQLAEDLAHRDRELVGVRHRAEERERALKKMLVEVEVSNVDIEKRLAAAATREVAKSGVDESYTESINDMLQQALSEEDTFSVADDASIMEDEGGLREDLITPRGTMRDSDTVSLSSTTSSRKGRGWKGYFWGTKSMSEDDVKIKRGAPRRNLAQDVVREDEPKRPKVEKRGSTTLQQTPNRAPPPSAIYTLPHHAAHRSQPKPPKEEKEEVGQANSVAQWALRLVNNAPPTDEPDSYGPESPTRSRAQSSPVTDGSERARRTSSRTEDVPKARLTKPKPRTQSMVTPAPPATGKSAKFFADIRETAERMVPLGTQTAKDAKKDTPNAGPVEMDMILPAGVQPPTFQNTVTADYLTDRFGFIYDKRQKAVSGKSVRSLNTRRESPRRESPRGRSMSPASPEDSGSRPRTPAKTAMADSTLTKTPTRWQELMRGPTSDPTPKPLSLAPPSLATQGTLISRLSKPASSLPSSASPTTAFSHVPIPSPESLAPSAAEDATVRLLLGQLSDLHDTLQRDRSHKWNAFLLKIRPANTTSTPEAALTDGALIGFATLGSSGAAGKQRWKEFKQLVLGGIPVSYRWKIWAECSGASELRVPGYYADILSADPTTSDADSESVLAQIDCDIGRTLTDNVFFREGPGVGKLRNVLVAYARRNKSVGYCQGMNLIAASLLIIMPSEEDAFWVLVAVVERILPKTYYEPSLRASRADQLVLRHYVTTLLPTLSSHLDSLAIELSALTFQWFLTVFTDTLAAEALFRVWDVLLCVSGSTFLFQVAIALLRLNEKDLLECNDAASIYNYLGRGMVHEGVSVEGLMREAWAWGREIKRKDVEARREEFITTEMKEMGELESELGEGDLDGAPKEEEPPREPGSGVSSGFVNTPEVMVTPSEELEGMSFPAIIPQTPETPSFSPAPPLPVNGALEDDAAPAKLKLEINESTTAAPAVSEVDLETPRAEIAKSSFGGSADGSVAKEAVEGATGAEEKGVEEAAAV